MAAKELQLRRERDGMIVIRFEGGGEVPASLSGRYTNERVASQAIHQYLSTRRRKPSAKKKESSGA